MLYRLGYGLDERGFMTYGYIYPHQLWLPFDHLDFTLTRSEVSFWRSHR